MMDKLFAFLENVLIITAAILVGVVGWAVIGFIALGALEVWGMVMSMLF